jgi:DamX protein
LRLTEVGGDSGLRIVFFAEAYFVQMLDKAIARLEKPLAWHEIRLTAFSHEEVKQYLQLRFESAGYSLPLPFTEAELQGIVSSSGGLPGKIDQITAGLLDGVLTVREAPGWLPPWHRALAALLVVTIGITWLVWDRTEERAPAGFRSAAVTRDITSVQPLDVPERSPASPEGTTGPGIMTGIEDVVAEAEPKSSEVATEQITPTREDPIIARADLSMPEANVEVAPEPRRQESAPPPTPPPPAAQPRPARVESRRGSFDLAWIDAQGDDRFTLQLLGTSSRGRVEEYLARQAEGTPIAAYESHRNAGPWYVVIYGSYSSSDAATAASKRLPASIGKVSPWVRRFGSLRTDIKR